MNIRIVKGEMKYLDDCYDALINSEIGKAYFTEFNPKGIMAEGIENGEMDIALNMEDDKFLGFIWYELDGAFGMHAYLHIIAIKEEFRGMGIGQKLISDFEKKVFEEDDKIFLMVAEFNSEAKRLYERLGYKRVGMIPDFYRLGVNEFLLMKTK